MFTGDPIVSVNHMYPLTDRTTNGWADFRVLSVCGAELVRRLIEGRDRHFCERCDRPVYRNPKPCAGVLVVNGAKVLLIERTQPPAVGSWSVPAGYLEADEPPRVAAVRELEEETSVSVSRDSLSDRKSVV